MESLTLEQASYLAEIIGVVAVVASIIYLAIQVKQNNISIRLNTIHDIHTGFNAFYQSLGENGELADIYHRGLYDFEQLDKLEKLRFITLMNRALRITHEMYYQRHAHTVDDKLWDAFTAPLKDAFKTEGFLTYWGKKSHWYDQEFQDFVQNTLMMAEGTKPLYDPPDN